MQYHIRENEKNRVYRTVACSEKAGHHIGQSVLIIDLDGMALMQIYTMMGFIQKLLFVDNSYYPECLGKILVVNSGYVFSGIWRCISPLLPKETVAKISILGSSYQSEVMQLVDKENLPVFLGGDCECEGGCENADVGLVGAIDAGELASETSLFFVGIRILPIFSPVWDGFLITDLQVSFLVDGLTEFFFPVDL